MTGPRARRDSFREWLIERSPASLSIGERTLLQEMAGHLFGYAPRTAQRRWWSLFAWQYRIDHSTALTLAPGERAAEAEAVIAEAKRRRPPGRRRAPISQEELDFQWCRAYFRDHWPAKAVERRAIVYDFATRRLRRVPDAGEIRVSSPRVAALDVAHLMSLTTDIETIERRVRRRARQRTE